MKLLKHIVTGALLCTSLFAAQENNETRLTPDQLEAENAEAVSVVDTIAIKAGYSRAFMKQTDDNGGIVTSELQQDGVAYSARVVFNNGTIPFFKPYVDFAAYIQDDREFYIPSVGLRHDFDLDSFVEPYASFGVGYNFSHRSEDPAAGLNAYQEKGGSPSMTVEGGFDFYITDNFALDLSARYDFYDIAATVAGYYSLTTIHDTGSLSVLAGLVYRFGDQDTSGDNDLDGVVNRKDHCPNTPSGAEVDAFGCALDSDEDGVIDLYDECPATLLGAPVDAKGCALDSDNDGVIDLLDRCPDTLANVPVTECGCPPYKFDLIRNYKFAAYKVEDLVDSPKFNAYEFLQKNPEYNVRVVGFADNVGSKGFNKKLAKKRAVEAKQFMVDKGIDASRIEVLGRGDREPLVSNDTQTNRDKNRRIFIQFYRVDKSTVK